jgi:hypothetical protein
MMKFQEQVINDLAQVISCRIRELWRETPQTRRIVKRQENPHTANTAKSLPIRRCHRQPLGARSKTNPAPAYFLHHL